MVCQLSGYDTVVDAAIWFGGDEMIALLPKGRPASADF